MYWLLRIFHILPFAIGGLVAFVLLILILGYLGILSPEQIHSLERLGTGVVTKKAD